MADPSLADLFARYAALLSAAGAPPARHEDLRLLLEDVGKANAALNLVSDASPAALFAHLLDSLQALADPAAARPGARLIDVGTGGGFPGLALLAARPDWRGVLLDSVRKKSEALAGVCARLGGRAEARWGRAEELGRDPAHRGAYDLAFCRALGRFATVLELTLPFLKVGGALLAHRGHEAPEETEAAGEALAALGGAAEGLTPYQLPDLDKKRYIVRVVKNAPTPDTYPRRDGVPAKRPL